MQTTDDDADEQLRYNVILQLLKIITELLQVLKACKDSKTKKLNNK